MLVLITGGAASGKSAFAEDMAISLGENRLYVATMRPVDQGCMQRIEKHRLMRAEKGFETVEAYTNLSGADLKSRYDVILLECLSNLLANEMYGVDSSNGDFFERIIDGIFSLQKRAEHMIVVSNEIFSDGNSYSPETLEYIQNLGRMNRHIAALSEMAVEIVCGIPIFYKGEDLFEKVH